MSNIDQYIIKTFAPGMVMVFGSFAPNGSSAISAASNKNARGWSVAYTSTGLYTLTFDINNKFVDKVIFLAWLEKGTGGDQFLQGGNYVAPTATAAATMEIRSWDVSGTGVADIAAAASNRINFFGIFRDTGLSTY